jgi:hypothetical protein
MIQLEGVLGVLTFIFWIWMLVDCARRGFNDGCAHALWFVFILLIPFVGSLVYFFAVYLPARKSGAG